MSYDTSRFINWTLKSFSALVVGVGVALFLAASSAYAQLNENCTASVLNRTTTINSDGSFTIPNIPVDQGFFRVRITCVETGSTLGGQSEFFVPVGNGTIPVGAIPLGVLQPPPTSIAIASGQTMFTTAGGTAQLAVTGTFPDGSTSDLTAQSTGTSYTTSNLDIATLTSEGLVTAGSTSGTAIVSGY